MHNVFRFTTWTKQGKIPAEVMTWYEHFKKKCIPAAIVKRADKEEYAVFREGVEAGDAKTEKIDPGGLEIVLSCHGFKFESQQKQTLVGMG